LNYLDNFSGATAPEPRFSGSATKTVANPFLSAAFIRFDPGATGSLPQPNPSGESPVIQARIAMAVGVRGQVFRQFGH
jgi:hypothetical protein